ncbi:LysR substrate-binding domain-containing protein [Achromobacter xylosoxidans]
MFTRVGRQVVLNDAGRYYANRIAPHLEEIELHTQTLMANRGVGGILELAVIPTFSSRWLLPRLHEFRALHPDITINFSEKPEPFLFAARISMPRCISTIPPGRVLSSLNSSTRRSCRC